MSIRREEIEDALFDLVQASTEFADENIFFSDQDGISPQPSPYATISIGDLNRVGIDASTRDFDGARTAGSEIVRTTMGMRELVCAFSFFTPKTVGATTAWSIAAKLEAELQLSSVRDGLNAVGLGVANVGSVRWVPKLNNTEFEGRAMLEVRFNVPQGASDAIGYIETVNVTPVIDGVTLPIITIPE